MPQNLTESLFLSKEDPIYHYKYLFSGLRNEKRHGNIWLNVIEHNENSFPETKL